VSDGGGLEVVGPTLTLRYATPADAPALLELAGDPDVTRYLSWGPYKELAEPAAYISTLVGLREGGHQLDLLIVHHQGGPAGVTGLSELSRRDRRAILGTWLGRSWWGTGVNAESKALVTALAFRAVGLDRLGAYANVTHARSQAALERLGFRREGVLRGFHRHGDVRHDVAIFSLLREEWESSPLATVATEIRGAPPEAFVLSR
jgi:ribosomal-protein-alanine N-acetyltransferase